MNGNEIESVIRPILVCERLKLEDLQKTHCKKDDKNWKYLQEKIEIIHQFIFENFDKNYEWEDDFGYPDKPKLNLKLNPNFEKYIPTEEDREEEIREMKESIIGMEGDR